VNLIEFFHYVNDFAEMEEQLANTRKFTGMTEAQVRELNEGFKKMDTRTSREQLNLLAQEAGRLGKTTKESVQGYVEAADIINVALVDLGQGATQEIAKLSSIFNVEDIYGTKDAMLKVGSTVNVLSQNCTASKPYIVEFTKRLAGVGAQARMTVPEIMAFAATLDANGQAVEMSASALSRTIMMLFQKPKEIAQTVGLDVDNFTKTLQRNTTEGLMMFFGALQNMGKEDALAALSPMFKDLGMDGVRMSTVLATVANKLDMVKWEMDEANKAFREGISATREYNIFNNTAQATIDKAKKRLHELSVELGENLFPLMTHFMSTTSAVVRGLVVTIRFISAYKTEIITLVSALALYKAAIIAHNLYLDLAAVKTVVATKATAAWQFVVGKLRGVLAIGRVAIAAMTNAIQYLTNGLNVNYTMQQRWRKAMAGMSFASWTGLILGLASAVFLLYRHMKRLEEERRVVEKIRDEAIKKVGEERVSIDLLVAAAQNETLSLEERKKAIDKLNAIIPDYNAHLDETSGRYRANKKALDDYLKSLTRQYELEGAKSKLSELGKEKAEAKAKLVDAQKSYSAAQATANASAGPSYTTSFGSVGYMHMDAASHLKSVLDSATAAYEEVLRKEQKILDAYGVDLQKEAANAENTAAELADTVASPGGGYHSSKDAAKEAKKAMAEAKRELAKQDKAYKAAMERAKGEYEAAMADNVIAYATGGRTYEDYIAEKERLDLKYVQDRLDIYNSLYENETKEDKALLLKYDEDYQALLLKKAEMEKKFADARAKSNIDKLQREMKAEQDALELLFNNPDSNLYGDTLAQQEVIHQLKIKYLALFRDQYKAGSKEYLQYERQLEDENGADILAKRKAYIAKLEEWRKSYSYLTLSKRRDMEIKVLDELYSRGIVKEEEYQRILAQIRKKYSSEAMTSEDGKIDYRSSSDQIQGKRGAEAGEKDKEFARIQALYEKGELTEEQYHQARRNVAKHYADLMYEDIRSGLDEQTKMLFDLGTAWQNMFAGIAETGKISFEDIGSVAQTTFAVMSAGLEMYGQFAAAQSRIEIANMERRYDAEIEAAEGNRYKVNKLEKKKEADMAKLKKEATRKEFNIKVISAVAQTAQNALAAYGAGLQAGFPMALWLAPTLAGLATANGLVQIALLKKQQQAAEAEGYAEGGFTRKGSKYEPAGIVHAGEWVASQKLLANPVARPLIEALDYAQRTNTLGSLKSEDVSRAITAPVAIAQMTENSPSSMVLAAAVMQTSSVVKELTDRLNEPFVTVNTVTGDYGINRALEQHRQLMKNKSPKSQK
ncbi:phage tail tape measure protein, partial [Muribaculum intestinale]|uniref:phage tail tape measure protein n=1 Tax=Muribaculum intestinale TaxID=1796646 RepID=UPI002629BBC9